MGICSSKPEIKEEKPDVWDPIAARKKREEDEKKQAELAKQQSSTIPGPTAPKIPSPQAHTSPGGASVESATSTIATSPLAQKQTSKRLASMSKGQQPAIRLVGFSGIHGYADLDGLYAENSDDVYYQRLPPQWCLWFCVDRCNWYISPDADDFDGRVVEGPDDHEALLSPYGTWLIKGKDGKFEHVPNVVATQSYNNIVKTGYLTKSPPPGAMKGWKRRYFVLSGASEVTGEAKLEYYEDEDSVRGSEPKGVVLLESVLNVEQGDGPKKNGADTFCVRLEMPGRVMELQAATKIECRMWAQAIGNLVARKGSTASGRIKEGILMRAIGKSDKYQKFFATLDSVSLKLFDEDSGTTKTMESEYNLEDVQGIEPVPQSAYFSVSLGGKSSVKFQAPSNAESADWQKEIGALTVARRRLSTSAGRAIMGTPAGDASDDIDLSEIKEGEDTTGGFGSFKSGPGALADAPLRDDPTNCGPDDNYSDAENEDTGADAGNDETIEQESTFGDKEDVTREHGEDALVLASDKESHEDVTSAPDSVEMADSTAWDSAQDVGAPEEGSGEEGVNKLECLSEEEQAAMLYIHEQKAAKDKAAKDADAAAAAKIQAAEEEAARQQAAEEEAAQQKAAEEAARQKAAEEEAAQQKAAEEEAAQQKAAEEEAAQQKAAEEEAAQQKAAETAVEAESALAAAHDDDNRNDIHKSSSFSFSDLKTVDDTIVWLTRELGAVTPSVEAALRENEVDGDAFLELTEADWKEVIPQVGARRKITNLVVKTLSAIAQETNGSSRPTPAASPATEQKELNAQKHIEDDNDMGQVAFTFTKGRSSETLTAPASDAWTPSVTPGATTNHRATVFVQDTTEIQEDEPFDEETHLEDLLFLLEDESGTDVAEVFEADDKGIKRNGRGGMSFKDRAKKTFAALGVGDTDC